MFVSVFFSRKVVVIAGESDPRGPHLENLVLMDRLLYWKGAAGHEEDFAIETAHRGRTETEGPGSNRDTLFQP